MGFSGWEIALVLVIVLLIFGGKKLRGLGGDLGEAIKGFKSSMTGESTAATETNTETDNVEQKKEQTE